MPTPRTIIKQSRALTAAAIRLESCGEWWPALRRRREALAILTQNLGDKHPETAMALAGVAQWHIRRGEDIKAEPILQKSLRMLEQTPAANSHSGCILGLLGEIYERRGSNRQALSAFSRALPILEDPAQPEPEIAHYFRQKMAQLYIDDGSEEMAIAVAPASDRDKIRQAAAHHRFLPDEDDPPPEESPPLYH